MYIYILTSLLSLMKNTHFLTALANVLENYTALFGDILLRLPDITHEVKQKIFILKF